jgi:hypothetical protein
LNREVLIARIDRNAPVRRRLSNRWSDAYDQQRWQNNKHRLYDSGTHTATLPKESKPQSHRNIAHRRPDQLTDELPGVVYQ